MHRIGLSVFGFLLFLVFLVDALPAAAQSIPATRAAQQANGNLLFPCYAKKVRSPKTFSGFWKPKPQNDQNKEVGVLIGFDAPDPNFPFDCVGEPLEITVPNGQIVVLGEERWDSSCTPTLTVTKAVADSPVSDLLTLVTRVGIFGTDAQVNEYVLPALKNKILNISVVCSIPKTDTTPQRKLTQSVKITYQNPPRIAVSAGALVSTEGVKSYTILTTKTGVNGSGVATSQTSIGVSGNSSAQVVPFGFVSMYLAGSRQLNLFSQVGVGVNPNLSTAKVEFFAAPIGIAWHDFYFAPGIHFGQHEALSGGFQEGDIVTGLSKAPIVFHYRRGLAFSLSYNLKPLVKPSSSSSNAQSPSK